MVEGAAATLVAGTSAIQLFTQSINLATAAIGLFLALKGYKNYKDAKKIKNDGLSK